MIIVTGSKGFIGQHFVNYIQKCRDNPRPETYKYNSNVMGIDEDNELKINGTYNVTGYEARDQQLCKGYKAIINSNTGKLLGIGKKGWTPLNNSVIRDIGEKYVKAGILTL